jgi:hypothetical protein
MRIPIGSKLKLVRDLHAHLNHAEVVQGSAVEKALTEKDVTVLVVCNTAGTFPTTAVHPKVTLPLAKFQCWFDRREENGVKFQIGNDICIKERGVRFVLAVLEKGLRSSLIPKTLNYELFELILIRELENGNTVFIQRGTLTEPEWLVVKALADLTDGKVTLFENPKADER